MNADQLLYAKTHEWVHVDDMDGNRVATVGISAFAVEQLTDLVFMELPKKGTVLQAGESLGEIESVKAVSDVYSPVSGEVIAINEQLPKQLEVLSTDPYGDGWLVKIRLTDESGLKKLMDHQAYQAQCAEEG